MVLLVLLKNIQNLWSQWPCLFTIHGLGGRHTSRQGWIGITRIFQAWPKSRQSGCWKLETMNLDAPLMVYGLWLWKMNENPNWSGLSWFMDIFFMEDLNILLEIRVLVEFQADFNGDGEVVGIDVVDAQLGRRGILKPLVSYVENQWKSSHWGQKYLRSPKTLAFFHGREFCIWIRWILSSKGLSNHNAIAKSQCRWLIFFRLPAFTQILWH